VKHGCRLSNGCPEETRKAGPLYRAKVMTGKAGRSAPSNASMVENLAVALMLASWLKMCSKWGA